MLVKRNKKNKLLKTAMPIVAVVALIVSIFVTVSPKMGLPGWSDIFNGSGVTTKNVDAPNSPLTVHFIDVGQGDSILIKYENNAMLIDAGEHGNEETVINYIKNQGIKKLDYVVTTHPHSDHIGSMPDVIGAFEILNVIVPKLTENNLPTTKTYENFLLAVSKSGAKGINAVVGNQYNLGSARFEILAPSEQSDNLNNMSVVIRLDFGETSFLFMGDAEKEEEKQIIKNFSDKLDVDVLKTGHHGSKSSSSVGFLKEVTPNIAIISCGEGNLYGHPNVNTLEALEKIGAQALRTDLAGTIVVGSDGEKLMIDYKNK